MKFFLLPFSYQSDYDAIIIVSDFRDFIENIDFSFDFVVTYCQLRRKWHNLRIDCDIINWNFSFNTESFQFPESREWDTNWYELLSGKNSFAYASFSFFWCEPISFIEFISSATDVAYYLGRQSNMMNRTVRKSRPFVVYDVFHLIW